MQVEKYSSVPTERKLTMGRRQQVLREAWGWDYTSRSKLLEEKKHLSSFKCLPYTRMDSYWLIIFHITDKTNKAKKQFSYWI